ncbi:MAG TPA: hypothetical protein VJU78_00470 [Chitinophagaceae bacterium]|nr:hypothetical protein [Chitinophagaceae bacterium]
MCKDRQKQFAALGVFSPQQSETFSPGFGLANPVYKPLQQSIIKKWITEAYGEATIMLSFYSHVLKAARFLYAGVAGLTPGGAANLF